MGLCKCPKRKVTNQFCFEHRVNVCEHCMVQKHPKCVVQGYLQWLQDSDYDPKCICCRQELAEEECVRLVCYHVLHWVCLDEYARQLGADTAPAGYTCPACNAGIFPPDNLVSPVADKLRAVLSDVNWARAGLGLPLLEERVERKPEFTGTGAGFPSGPRPTPEGQSQVSLAVPSSSETSSSSAAASSSSFGGANDQWESVKPTEHSLVINFDTTTSRKSGSAVGADFLDPSFLSSPLLASGGAGMPTSDTDRDDNKYKRRPAAEQFMRWLRSLLSPSARRRQSKTQRCLQTAALAALGILVLVLIFSYLGRSGGDFDDPLLDPINNPNIRVNDRE